MNFNFGGIAHDVQTVYDDTVSTLKQVNGEVSSSFKYVWQDLQDSLGEFEYYLSEFESWIADLLTYGGEAGASEPPSPPCP